MKLSDLDPQTVGREATAAVIERLARLAIPLSPGVMLHLSPVQGDTDLGLTVASLCAWAQHGELGDWADHGDAADALQSAAEALLSSPARPWAVADLDALDDVERGEELGAVRLVLAAALTRLRICRGEVVTLDTLSRLASLTRQRLQQIVADGDLQVTAGKGSTPTTVAPDEARRWLAARGVRGW